MISERDTTPPKSGKELGRRVASALVLAAVVLSALLFGGLPFALVWLAAGIVGLSEWLAMTGAQPSRQLLLAGGATLSALVFILQAGAPATVIAGILAVGLVVLVLLARDGVSRRNASIGLLAAAIIVLVPTILRDDPNIGIVGPAWMFAVVWATDIAAYFTGRTFGGPKLMPIVSPNKTWSGAIGGFVAAVLAGTGIAALAQSHGVSLFTALPVPAIALASGVASIVSQAGDLFESGLKRHYGVKDSGHSIPGHGGVMDRLDGFFAVALLVGGLLLIQPLLMH